MPDKNHRHNLESSFVKSSSKTSLAKKAFSLVEISVVIVIIGILIAGIAKGVDLYQDFKLTSARNLTNNSVVSRIPNLTLWFESTSEKSFSKTRPQDNEVINLWKDINPIKTATLDLNNSENQPPIYKINGINSLPAISFNGTNQSIQRNNILASQFLGYDQATIIVVYNYISGSCSQVIWNWGTNTETLNFSAPWNSEIYFWFGNSNNRISATIDNSSYRKNPQIVTFLKDPLKASAFRNSALVFSSNYSQTISPNTISNLVIGGIPNYLCNALIGELVFFSRALTAKERIAVEQYLGQKWGIKVNN